MRGERGKATHIIEEPDEGDAEEAETVEFEDEKVGGLAAHGVFVKVLGIFKLDTEIQEDKREDNTNAEGGAPHDLVVFSARGDDD